MDNLSRRAAWLVLVASPFALPINPAAAQDPTPAAPPASPPGVTPAPEAAPAPAPPAVAVEVAVATPAPPAPEAAAAEPVLAPALTLSLFADAYFGLQTSGSGTVATLSGHRAWTGQGSTGFAENGFSLSWLGLDANYDAGMFAVTGSLRFGSAVPIYHGGQGDDAAFGVENISQGFVTWRPIEKLDLDLGLFGTPFGAEVPESWKNLNYTRGALYYYGQPAYHTGLRAKYRISDQVSVTGLLVDGVNTVSETQQNNGIDQSPTIGAQVGITPSDTLSIAAGGLVALDGEENDDGGFDTFLDLVAVLSLDPVTVVFNADYVLTQAPLGGQDDRSFFGLSGALGYAFTNNFGIAGRLEFLTDSYAGGLSGDAAFDGSDKSSWNLITATVTLDYKPIPDAPNLIIRWDNRFEKSNQDVFGDSVNDALDDGDDTFKNNWFQSVIGVVVTTSP
jgi:hypothetical protein